MTNAENNFVGVFENTLTESADSDINGRITTVIGYKFTSSACISAVLRFASLTVFNFRNRLLSVMSHSE